MKRILLYKSTKQATVSDEDFEYLSQFRWYVHSKGYAVRTIPNSGSKKSLMHVEVLERKLGRKLEKSEVPDHKNRVLLCNLRSNLRSITQSQNKINTGRWKHNTSGYKGISRHKLGLWRARLVKDDHEHCSYHKTRAEASKAYKIMLEQFYPGIAL